jgi:hypothetical protein
MAIVHPPMAKPPNSTATTAAAIRPPLPHVAATVPVTATPGPASLHTGFVRKVKFILMGIKGQVILKEKLKRQILLH